MVTYDYNFTIKNSDMMVFSEFGKLSIWPIVIYNIQILSRISHGDKNGDLIGAILIGNT